jgi:hypothetical protein
VEGVANGNSQAKHIVGMEIIGVVEDPIIVRLGTDKDISPYPVVDRSAHVKQKMIAIKMG